MKTYEDFHLECLRILRKAGLPDDAVREFDTFDLLVQDIPRALECKLRDWGKLDREFKTTDPILTDAIQSLYRAEQEYYACK